MSTNPLKRLPEVAESYARVNIDPAKRKEIRMAFISGARWAQMEIDRTAKTNTNSR